MSENVTKWLVLGSVTAYFGWAFWPRRYDPRDAPRETSEKMRERMARERDLDFQRAAYRARLVLGREKE